MGGEAVTHRDAGQTVDGVETNGERPPVGVGRTPRPRAGTGGSPTRPPRVLVVDPSASEAYTEIDDAVADADDGDSVLVRPGLYHMPVVVDRAIEIIGDGPRKAIILEPAGAEALSLVASGAVIRQLTVRPGSMGNDGAAHSAVWVSDVVATVEDCDLSSHLGATVWVGGRSSRATIRRCVIRDGAQNGVAAMEEGTAIVEGCEIRRHAWPGVLARGSNASVTIRDCRIEENLNVGVAADGRALVVITDSRIARNAFGGIMLEDAAPASRVESNVIEENGAEAILILGGVGTRIARNHLRRNGMGVMVAAGASPTIAENQFGDNAGPAVQVAGERSDPSVVDNTIVTPRAVGIGIADGGRGRFERNRVTAGSQPGIWVQDHESSPTVIDNVVTGSLMVGVAVSGHGGGAFYRNDLRGNRAGAWDLTDAGPVTHADNLEEPDPGTQDGPPAGFVH